MIQIQLWLFVFRDFLSVDVCINAFGFTKDLQSWIDTDRLSDS